MVGWVIVCASIVVFRAIRGCTFRQRSPLVSLPDPLGPGPRRFRPLVLELVNALLERAQCPGDRDPFTVDDDFAQSRADANGRRACGRQSSGPRTRRLDLRIELKTFWVAPRRV